MPEQLLTVAFLTGFLAATLRMATPILITALGEMFAERSGIMNLGIEGIMILGAFAGFAVAFLAGNLWMGLLGGGLAGALLGLIMGIASTRFQGNQTVAGLGIWIVCQGMSSFLNRSVFGVNAERPTVTTFAAVRIPWLADIPIVGDTLFNQNALV